MDSPVLSSAIVVTLEQSLHLIKPVNYFKVRLFDAAQATSTVLFCQQWLFQHPCVGFCLQIFGY